MERRHQEKEGEREAEVFARKEVGIRADAVLLHLLPTSSNSSNLKERSSHEGNIKFRKKLGRRYGV